MPQNRIVPTWKRYKYIFNYAERKLNVTTEYYVLKLFQFKEKTETQNVFILHCSSRQLNTMGREAVPIFIYKVLYMSSLAHRIDRFPFEQEKLLERKCGLTMKPSPGGMIGFYILFYFALLCFVFYSSS